MKRLLTLMLLLLVTVVANAQKLEVNIYAGTGLYNYTGSGTNTYSTLLLDYDKTGYINNPYGRKATFSYEAGLQAKWVTSSGFLFGAKAGYQILRSKTELNGFFDLSILPYADYLIAPNYTPNNAQPKIGSGTLSNQYIDLAPYIGYRFQLGKISMDAMPGVSFGIPTYSKEKAEATPLNANQTYRINQKMDNPKSDTRLNLNLAFNFQQWGITAGYSHGVTNYLRGMEYIADAPATKAYSQLFSAGLLYRLK